MCGITGIVNFENDKPVQKEVIISMTDILSHRGPDDHSIYLNGNVALGHRRLSIIDLSAAGRQPMSNEDETVWVVFNGEIYNYIELKSLLLDKGHKFKSKTDTEVIVHAFEEYGKECFKYFDGMFSIGIWDDKAKTLVLCRDRLGIKPLYYYYNKSFISFASEIKSLIQNKAVEREVDEQALSNFLTLHYVPSPRTMFKNIAKLQPGTMLTLKNNSVKIEKYWELDALKQIDTRMLPNIEEYLLGLLKQSVAKRMQSDVPVGTLLSGGLDSSAILSLCTQIAKKPIPAFSVGYSKDGGDKYSEFHFARIVAKYLNSNYHEIVLTPDMFIEFLPKAIWYQDEPIGEPASIPLYYVCRLAKDMGVTVLLTGEGADELFAGYNRHWGEMLSQYYSLLPKKAMNLLFDTVVSRIPKAPLLKKGHRTMIIKDFKDRYMSWHTVFTNDLKHHILNSHSHLTSTFQDAFQGLFATLNNIDDLKKMLYLDMQYWLPDDLLMKKDKMGMATSVEARVPFLDHSIVEFAYSLPSNLKVNRFRTKYVLKRALKNILPKKIIQRKKEGFPTPIPSWLRSNFKGYIMDVLCSKTYNNHYYFNRDVILDIVEKHIDGREDYNRLIFPLLNFEIWYKLFFSGSSPN